MQLQLTVLEGPDSGKNALITGSDLFIGRDASRCNLVLADPNISRLHARASLTNDERICLEDMGSSNGTYVNDAIINGPVEIGPGDRIRLGSSLMELVPAAQAVPASSEKGEGANAFSVLSSPTGEKISFTRAFSAPFAGRASFRWLLGSILAVIPIAGILANGYRYQLLKHGQAGNISLPEWKDWGELFLTGLQFFLVRVAYLALPVLFTVLVILYSPPAPVDRLLEMLYYLRGWLLLLSLLLLALAGCIIPVALAHFAATGLFKDAFQLTAILQVIKVDRLRYLALIFAVAGMWLVVSLLVIIPNTWLVLSLMTIMPYAGILLAMVGAFYVQIVSALLFGELYGRSKVESESY